MSENVILAYLAYLAYHSDKKNHFWFAQKWSKSAPLGKRGILLYTQETKSFRLSTIMTTFGLK